MRQRFRKPSPAFSGVRPYWSSPTGCATVEAADKIIVLSGGQVAEEGSPSDLMSRNGLFHHMVELQKQSAGWKLR